MDRLPSRKQRRKPLQRIVINNVHTTPLMLREFPEQKDYHPRYMRSIIRNVQRLGDISINRDRKLYGQLRTAAQIKLSGVNYRNIVKKSQTKIVS